MPLKINRKKFLARRETAKRHWINTGASPEQIAAKYQVSKSTAYRWIKDWKEEES